jgi:hypothetical protein
MQEIIQDQNFLKHFKNEETLKYSQLFLSSLINFYKEDPIMF